MKWWQDSVSLSGAAFFLAMLDAWWLNGPVELFVGTGIIYLGCCITHSKTIDINVTIEEKE